ncbi:MAG: glycosyltransferase [Bacteroidaceae bacterium]|nr:glycosyltransferase [Bacteroidaceae bacterium]
MNIAIIISGKMPVSRYGGTGRVMWDLGKALVRQGHRVSLFADRVAGDCSFAPLTQLRRDIPLRNQIEEDTDIIHFNTEVIDSAKDIPHVVTIHGNDLPQELDANTIFVSRNHARRCGSDSFVYNGLDWESMPQMDLYLSRSGYHFLGKAAWSVKNVRGAIGVVKRIPAEELTVLGGYRLNFKMGFRLTLSRRVHFRGMVDDAEKYAAMQRSRGLLFPVTWHEPFGLAVIESLYAGCPVFGTPYGSLPELVGDPQFGFLTDSAEEMADHLRNRPEYDARVCHEYARDCFSADVMARSYVEKYERVLNGEPLNREFGEREPAYRNLIWKS